MNAEEARDLLARERDRIEHALRGLTQPATEEDRAQAGDAGEGLVDEGLDEAQAAQLREELEAITRAEQRLADDTYGLSVQSGEPIPDARLRAIPWAERTAEEQARFSG